MNQYLMKEAGLDALSVETQTNILKQVEGGVVRLKFVDSCCRDIGVNFAERLSEPFVRGLAHRLGAMPLQNNLEIFITIGAAITIEACVQAFGSDPEKLKTIFFGQPENLAMYLDGSSLAFNIEETSKKIGFGNQAHRKFTIQALRTHF